MSIHIGPISGVSVHLSTVPGPVDGVDMRFMKASPAGLLCTDGGDRLEVNHVHTWTRDPAEVTCKACLEWLHA